jgi:iron complex outermembrane receptor protein
MRTYRFAIAHDFTDNTNGYFSFNRGVKSGQFDTFGTAETGPILSPPVNPETLYAYEIGVKSELMDHRLRLNADVFHYTISNLQLARIVSGATKLLNAAGAEINGLEADSVFKALPNLTLAGGLSLQYGHYTSFPNSPDYFTPSQTFDATGEQTVRTPKVTAHISADYLIPRPYGDFDLNANFTHTSSFQWFPDNSLPQPETEILNASVSWTAPSGRYDARIWGSNILGEKYYSFGSESAGLGEQFSPEPPATFGITLGYHFS